MAAFDTFKIWYALSLGSNDFTSASVNRRIRNTTTPVGEEISLIYCNPSPFQKRHTDVSNALAVDPTAPDTGTAASNVVLRFVQQRNVTPLIASVLEELLEMFYLFQSDDDFEKGRIGLENTDNPALDCLPIATAGYKIISFKQEPNQNNPSVTIYEMVLKFLGDHTKLGTRSP